MKDDGPEGGAHFRLFDPAPGELEPDVNILQMYVQTNCVTGSWRPA